MQHSVEIADLYSFLSSSFFSFQKYLSSSYVSGPRVGSGDTITVYRPSERHNNADRITVICILQMWKYCTERLSHQHGVTEPASGRAGVES